ncbi:hypothetical protein BCR39DRAFT_547029 [Naematelia encephala]|uniref:Mitochondrial import inner membrane translocase subunit Tim21 n=1 Tax=Naematelia encephala TaxID=71784 RepID=A0A1Y2AQ91_9TREE|nr:hypothetical protein BCR39DRAFT_547029 [Naematelia encephala]
MASRLPLAILVRVKHCRTTPTLYTQRFAKNLPALPLQIRLYATHRELPNLDTPSSSSSTFRDPKGRDSVGPFPLGVGPSGRSKAWRPWGQLGIGGKLVRTTQQTGNLTVILIGGALLVILTFALTTELFAPNSPSVLYSAAVDLIRASDALNPHLLPPLKFTHSPHASAPTRGSPPIAHTYIKHPTSGRDHMIMTFWVHGRGRDEPEPLGWVWRYWAKVESVGREFISWTGAVSHDDGAQRSTKVDAEGQGQGQGMASKGQSKDRVDQQQSDQDDDGVLGRWFGGWTSLRAPPGQPRKEIHRGLPPPGTYKVGEARAEYVKNAAGQFTLLTLVVDVPSSRASYPGHAVIYTSPEAAKEGLLGKQIR